MPIGRFEPRMGRNRESPDSEKEAFLEAAYQKAQALLEAEAVDINAFRGIYGEAEIREDAAKVSDYKRKFAANRTERELRDKKLATVVEAIFYDQVSRNGWLGAGAQVLHAEPVGRHR